VRYETGNGTLWMLKRGNIHMSETIAFLLDRYLFTFPLKVGIKNVTENFKRRRVSWVKKKAEPFWTVAHK